jgi:hypothetical protein
MTINANHCNLAFDGEIERCKALLEPRVAAVAGYPRAVIVDRLVQRVVDITRMPYTVATSVLYQAGSNSLPAAGTRLDCGRASFEIGSGKIRQSPLQWLTNQLEFLLHWAYCLLAMLMLKPGRGEAPTTLVFGVGEESILQDGSDAQFAQYCRAGPIAPLRDARRLLIQTEAQGAVGDSSGLVYARKPMIALMQTAKLGVRGRAGLAASHVGVLFAYMRAVLSMPELGLIGRDFAYVAMAQMLDQRRQMDAIVLTCSSFTAQPLWVRNFSHTPVHMIWYAQNWKPFVFLDDEVESDIPFLRWIRVDTHWAWTEAFAAYLQAVTGSKALAVGPIVWSLPQQSAPPEKTLDIAVFDVSPYADEVAFAYGEIPNYNHPDNVRSFIRDVVWLKAEMEAELQKPVRLRVKTKRGYKAAYDRGYFDALDWLAGDGVIVLEHHTANIYKLISECHLVIVYPFSSPAYVADFLKVPAIYYDPVGAIRAQNFGGEQSGIRFAAGREALLDTAQTALDHTEPTTY